MNSGQFYEITVTATVTATSGTVTNTATIGAPVGFFDTNSANDAANDTDSVTQSSDLSITSDDATTSVNAGGTTTYTVRVTNNGPSSVTAATLTDALATGLSKTGVVCSPTPGQCVSPPTVAQIQARCAEMRRLQGEGKLQNLPALCMPGGAAGGGPPTRQPAGSKRQIGI